MTDADEIRRQLTRWMQLDDSYQDEEWVEHVLDDEFEFFVGDLHFAGKETIRDLNKARNEGPPRGIHILSEPLIEWVEEGVVANVTTPYLYATPAEAGGLEVSKTGTYSDVFVKAADGRWRVRRRTNVPLAPPS